MATVTVWNEYIHEQESDAAADVYPEGMHATIAAGFEEYGFDTRTATLQEPEHGLSESVLDDTDVLVWWAHIAHDEVDDSVVERVHQRVLDGMGLIVLHSAHFAKIFKRLMGTTCNLKWREAGERERVWVTDPAHPITDGLDSQFVIPEAETYGEPHDVPPPEDLVFTSWFEGGEIFRSGCCYTRGKGRIFYFRPGHETYPIFYQDEVRKVLANAAEWAVSGDGPEIVFEHVEPLEE